MPELSPQTLALLDALPSQAALLASDGRILATNAAWRRFGCENGRLQADDVADSNYLVVCERAAASGDDHALRAAQGLRAVLGGRLQDLELDYPCHSPQRQRWYRMVARPVSDSGPARVLVLHSDVSERHHAREQATDMQRRLERLVDQAKVGILIHHNFKPILVNQELARMLGYGSPQEVLALDDGRRLYAPEEYARIEQYNAQRRRGEPAPSVYRITGLCRDGRRVIMENRAFTIEWGEQLAVCAMLTDITEQVRLQEQLRQSQRLDAVGQLTGGVAHDFNNLLTVILGNAELLAETLQGQPQLRLLADTTVEAAQRGAELTSRLLSFSRRQPLDPRVTDLARHLDGMDALLRRTLGEHITVSLQTQADLWPAMVDPGQLDNAVLNLCLNARDAMPRGGQLALSLDNVHLGPQDAEPDACAGDYVRIRVADTGSGMDEATRARAFEPFFTTKEVGEGSGLGLSMVYGFVTQSEGLVRIDSEPGQGTTISLYLPRAGQATLDAPAPVAAAAPARGQGRILMVEDDALVREHVTHLLRDLGYHVTAAQDGPSALDVLRREPRFDLLFTDVVMPGGMSGRDLADQALALHPGLPVLFTSGYAEEALAQHGRLMPGTHLLPKPYRKQQLATKVRDILGD